ncbi:Conserved hypothetical, protein [Geosmithia morbida]|uniref:Conserved hypothetical, protein n=1 Tax=Geosmithia morbida TaxID=1094350 RepID=A0A9P4YXW3_9HYPO|nr:Conserved hypothetical, protein [Geosmithia morbida]KAF4124060.1 Conserved hypothetical, protein [Geosmithia morbida]
MALGPQFFIIRRHEMQTISPDGQTICEQTHTIVPLIPVDLLPEWVEVCSVPRRLDLEDTTGMTNLGTFDAAEQVLGLQSISSDKQGGRNRVGMGTDTGTITSSETHIVSDEEPSFRSAAVSI